MLCFSRQTPLNILEKNKSASRTCSKIIYNIDICQFVDAFAFMSSYFFNSYLLSFAIAVLLNIYVTKYAPCIISFYIKKLILSLIVQNFYQYFTSDFRLIKQNQIL